MTIHNSEPDLKTKKHLREMNALVNHNIYLSQFGKKILYSNGFAAMLNGVITMEILPRIVIVDRITSLLPVLYFSHFPVTQLKLTYM